MLKMYRAFELVTIGCFFYLFLFRFTLPFTKVKSCDVLVMLATERDFFLTCLDGIKAHCPPVLTKASYFCGSDVLFQ